jgi:DNA-binding response OmpR family regulator
VADSRRARIAVIEDDTALASLLHDLLGTLEGHEILICTDGDRAYDFVVEHRPDLVLLDVWLGGRDNGWTLLRRLGRDPATRRVPVIVCSAALGELQDRESHLRRRGVELLPKPFDLDELLEKVRAALARRPV